MIGEPSVLAEAELIEATTAALAAVSLHDITVRLSDRRFLSALATDAGLPEESWDRFFITLDKLDKIGWDGVRTELTDIGLPTDAITAALDKISNLRELPAEKLADALTNAVPSLADTVVNDLAATTASLDRLAEQRPLRWEFDPTLVRGMGYYTGQIFEITHPEMSSSVAGGGRYDKLIGRSLGKDVPACGFSIGFERIVGLLNDEIARNATAVLAEADVPVADALAVARALRSQNRIVEVLRRSGKIGAQLKRLQADGFTSFITVTNEDGVVVAGEERTI
ncbi:histidyl-tRNA synthetase [Nocardia sp. GAS34]